MIALADSDGNSVSEHPSAPSQQVTLSNQDQFIDYCGYRYRTLQHYNHSLGPCRCDGRAARALPFAYEICDNEEDCRHVCSSFAWQVDGLVFSDGALVCSASQASAAGAVALRAGQCRERVHCIYSGKCWCISGMLLRVEGCFSADSSFADVLLRRRVHPFKA